LTNLLTPSARQEESVSHIFFMKEIDAENSSEENISAGKT